MNNTYKITENEIEYEIYDDINGVKHWYLNDLIHRENGPAVESADGYKAWYKYSKRHREDGPARIHSCGIEEYWLNGKHYTEITSNEEWLLFQIIT
jgi:hypothetical protein